METFSEDGYEWARLYCDFSLRQGTQLTSSNEVFILRKDDEGLWEFLKELKNAGLCGIEGYYTDYTEDMQEKYQAMAKELGLIISGGTDFHAEMKPHISIGTGLGNLKIPYEVLEKIKEWRNINR